MNPTYACPKCASSRLKRIELPNLLLLHWVINPGLAVNEIVLGQRVPKLTLECQDCNLPLLERSLVPCPHCGVVHDGRIWRGNSALGNWLGPVCPACTKRIPALWGLASLAVLALTAPVWYLPYRFYFRDRKVLGPSTILPPKQPPSVRSSVKMGVFFGVMMFLGACLIPVLFDYARNGALDTHRLLLGLLISSLCGTFFAGSLHWYLNRRPRQPSPK